MSGRHVRPTWRRHVGQVLSWALLGAVVAAAVALIAVPKATGSRPLTVLSGSMTPTYGIGDAVIVRPVDPDELRVGDVITFQPRSGEPQLTTHRIIAEVFGSEGRQFQTQGDANGGPDLSPVKPEQVLGEVWYSVPMVGRVSVWMAGGALGWLVKLIAVGLLVYGGGFIAAGLVEGRRRVEATS